MNRLAPFTVACLVLVFRPAFATAQRGDVLILDREEHWIQTNPLEAFLEVHPDRRPQSDIFSTSLWRRYVATWEVVDQRLFLTDVAALREKTDADHFDTELYSVMSDVFPDERRVLATWFTGHVIVPVGDLIEYVHLDYASTYERYIVLTIKKGLLTNQRKMDSTEFVAFRKAQFHAYQKTGEYQKKFEELKKPGESDEEVESFLFKVSTGRYLSLLHESGN